MTPFWNHFFEVFFVAIAVASGFGAVITVMASLSCARRVLSVLGILFVLILAVFVIPLAYVASEHYKALRKNPPAAEAKP